MVDHVGPKESLAAGVENLDIPTGTIRTKRTRRKIDVSAAPTPLELQNSFATTIPKVLRLRCRLRQYT
jgi:hypothetical protein